jgi:hypothetical protein
MTRAQLIAALLAVVVVLVVIELVRRRRLSEEFSLLWVIASVGAVVLALWTGLLTGITRAIGALYETSTIFFFGLLFVMVVSLYYAVKISALTQEVRRLAQETALLRFRLEKLNEGEGPESSKPERGTQ